LSRDDRPSLEPLEMQRIVLDAAEWKTFGNFLIALTRALGAPDWHGASVDAFIDSMVIGDINRLEPPYTIVLQSLRRTPPDLQREVRGFCAMINQAAAAGRGTDLEVGIEIPV
jgi:hypothetical protein